MEFRGKHGKLGKVGIMSKDERDNEIEVVYKHNKMLEGQVHLNELQGKIFTSLIYKIQHEEVRQQYRFLSEEIRDTLGVTKDFTRFVEAVKSMQDKKITYWQDNIEIIVHLFSKLEIDHTLKDVVVELHPDLKAILFDRLQNNDKSELQKLSMRDYRKLSGEYAIRFYELIYRFRNQDPITVSLEDFMYSLNVIDYSFGDLNKQIKKWINTVNSDTCIEIYNYRTIRQKHRVAYLAFYVQEKEQLTLEFENTDNWVKDLFLRNGLTEPSAHGCEVLGKHSQDALRYAIGEFKIKAKNKFRGNAVAYIDKIASNYVGIKEPDTQAVGEGAFDADPLETIARVRGVGLATIRQQCNGITIVKTDNGISVSGQESDMEYFKAMYGDTAIALFGEVIYE